MRTRSILTCGRWFTTMFKSSKLLENQFRNPRLHVAFILFCQTCRDRFCRCSPTLSCERNIKWSGCNTGSSTEQQSYHTQAVSSWCLGIQHWVIVTHNGGNETHSLTLKCCNINNLLPKCLMHIYTSREIYIHPLIAKCNLFKITN